MSRQVFILALTLGALAFVVPSVSFGQVEDEPTTGELLENFFRDNEQASESDAQQLLEYLNELRSQPLNLNAVTREELAALYLLNEIQIENFLSYRTNFGALLNEYELQAVPGWDLVDIRRIRPFTVVQSGLDARSTPLWKGFLSGEDELIFRWGRRFPHRLPNAVEGQPNIWAFRYRHSFDRRMYFGLTAENDAGEAFFRGSNAHGFDFYSGHFFLQDINKTVKVVALGDYSARMGQGLLLQTGFAAGKSAESTAIARGGRQLRPYASFGEAYFLRGAATTLSLGRNWEITALASVRRRDGNVLAAQDSTDLDFPETVFTSLQTSGLHRTEAERSDEKQVEETLGGLTVSRIWKNGQVSANGIYLHYDKPWQPSPAPYRQFAFTGTELAGGSIDYFWRQRNWFVFGELARSDNGGMALINGLLFNAERHVTLAVLHRHLGRDYQSVYGAPFAETTGASNENGVYVGADIRFGRKWQINSYFDIWKHPWLRFGVDAPSTGSEYLGRIIWKPQRNVSFYILWQQETKERNSGIPEAPGLVDNRRGRLRLHATYRVHSALELRSRVEWSRFQEGSFSTAKGFFAYQEAVFRALGFPLSGSFRYAIFDTENYDARVYAYENDLFSAISIPAFAGRGSRYFINLSWRVNPWLRLESRFEHTFQQVAGSSSGFTGRQTSWKFQVRMRF